MTANDDPRVEAAAEALTKQDRRRWSVMAGTDRDQYRDFARAALAAADAATPDPLDRETAEAARALLNAVETIRQTGGAVEIAGVRIEPCDTYGRTATTRAADAAAPARTDVIHLSDPQHGPSFCGEPVTVITEAGDTRPVCQACHRGAMKHVAAAAPARTHPGPDPDGGVLTGPETAAMVAAGKGETVPDRLDQIEARANAATPGPWKATWEEADDWWSITGAPHDGMVCPEVATVERGGDKEATFIAHARTDVPALVAALRAVLDLADLADRQKRTSFPDRMKPEVFAELNTRDIRAAIKEALS